VASDDEPDDEDPFDGLTFDDAFVDGARVREATAEERIAHRQRIDTEHRRLLAEARERAALADAVPAASVAPRPPKRRPWAILVLVALVAAFLVVRTQDGTDSGGGGGVPVSSDGGSTAIDRAAPDATEPTVGSVRVEGGQPPPGVESRLQPLGQPEPLPSGSGPFAFTARQANGEPVAYDPCRPIHVVVNGGTAPPEGPQLLAEALDRVTRATGLQFVVDGPTSEAPAKERPPYQPDRYRDRWAPVLVAWSDPGETGDLADVTAGSAGSVRLELQDGSAVYVTGSVVLDGPQIVELLKAPNGEAYARSVVQHELAHLVGLDHVNDPSQLMNPEGNPNVTEFGAGDLTGLAELGQGRCFPNV
jgi:hypothetical protein